MKERILEELGTLLFTLYNCEENYNNADPTTGQRIHTLVELQDLIEELIIDV